MVGAQTSDPIMVTLIKKHSDCPLIVQGGGLRVVGES